MSIVVGIDPGKNGALVRIEGDRVTAVRTWDTVDDVAPLVMAACAGADLAVVEWASKPRGRGERMSPAARVTLSMRVQMALSGAACAGVRVVHVDPDQWRRDVLGLTKGHDGASAKLAAEWACWGGGWRRQPVDLGLCWPEDVERSSHVAEAACLAAWGVRHG